MLTYVQIFDKVIAIAKSYYIAGFLVGFTPELLNILLTNHIELVRSATTYEQAMSLANDAMVKHMSMGGVRVENFITVENDRRELYSLYSQWRSLLLTGSDQ